jgi:HSP20 family protein
MFSLVPWKERLAPAPRSHHPIDRLHEQFNALFDRLLADWPAPSSAFADRGQFWGLDVEDTEQEVLVRAEAPGFEAGDFDVQLHGNALTIRAETKQEGKEGEGETRRSERSLVRSVTLPAGVDPEKVEATYRNGVLEIRLRKTPEAQGRRVEVQG